MTDEEKALDAMSGRPIYRVGQSRSGQLFAVIVREPDGRVEVLSVHNHRADAERVAMSEALRANGLYRKRE